MAAGAPLAHAGVELGAGSGWWVSALALAVPAAMYLFGLRRAARAYRRRWSAWRAAAFVTGCALVAVALSPPVEQAASDGVQGHVVQHLLLAMYAPLGLVLGAPVTLLLAAAPVGARSSIRRALSAAVVRVPTHLAIATVLNVAAVYLLYLTPLYALSARSDTIHHLVHVHFLVGGYAFAWVVTGPDPSRHRPRLAWRVGAVIATSAAHSFLAKLLYSRAPRWPPAASVPRIEIEAAAQWMYYGGHLAELLLLIALFATWYRRAPRLRPTTPTRPDRPVLASGAEEVAVARWPSRSTSRGTTDDRSDAGERDGPR